MRLDLRGSLTIEERLSVVNQVMNVVRMHVAKGARSVDARTVAPNEGELARAIVKSDAFEAPTAVVVE